jgi:hypothetical protein
MIMRTANGGGRNQRDLAKMLENNISAQVLKDLQETLPTAVRTAIAKAANKLPKRKGALTAVESTSSTGMPVQHGVRRPGADGKCGQVWGIFDSLTAKHKRTATVAEALEVARKKGLNDNTVRANYSAWKKFNGVSGRTEKTH